MKSILRIAVVSLLIPGLLVGCSVSTKLGMTTGDNGGAHESLVNSTPPLTSLEYVNYHQTSAKQDIVIGSLVLVGFVVGALTMMVIVNSKN